MCNCKCSICHRIREIFYYEYFSYLSFYTFKEMNFYICNCELCSQSFGDKQNGFVNRTKISANGERLAEKFIFLVALLVGNFLNENDCDLVIRFSLEMMCLGLFVILIACFNCCYFSPSNKCFPIYCKRKL
jgi:hypothetical protein